MRLHPAVWLCAWSVFALLLQGLDTFWLLLLLVPSMLLTGIYAASESLQMLKRVRWLLMSIAVIFIVATPGVRMPGVLGTAVSVDGFRLAADHILRLVLLLVTLATLLKVLGQSGVLAGLHALLKPIGLRRQRLVSRLMLTLEYASKSPAQPRWQDWLLADPDDMGTTVSLVSAPLRGLDMASISLLLLIVCGVALS